jgi:hypothetical protein
VGEGLVTTGQRWVVIIAGVAAILMLLFPPWETFGGRYMGHSVFTTPPGQADYRPGALRWTLPPPEPTGRISVTLLVIEYAALGVCAAAAFMLFAAPRGRGGDRT